MAETQSGETIRSMITGFNAMQAQLGLLPVQGGTMPMGVTLPPPPPPPEVMSPGEASTVVNEHMQHAMQQTVQAAQMTRYIPPPSSPPMGGGGAQVSGGGGLGNMGMNPFVAQAMAGGGAPGGALGMPHPMMMTSPMFGAYRPQGAVGMPHIGTGHVPAPLPFAPQMPQGMFGQPHQQDYRLMQAHQGARAGGADTAFRGGLGLAGGVAGGVLGSAFGPLGTMAGAYIGGKALPALGGLVTGSAMSDIEHGRRIQNMTSPYMVGGASLNPFTGQGMHREGAESVARGLRTMTRDHQFERQTEFNTADVRKITQLASDQGMLETSQNPDDIIRKVKAISKSVKVLMAVTGDPDVKAAIAGLGRAKHLGFEGLAAQTGAVVSTQQMARMAGVSQQAMVQQYGMPGAMMAQQVGMVGATGYQAGMMGGAAANAAVGAGVFSDLQKARAGGRAGIAQTNMMAYLGAANQDTYMAAALSRGEEGELAIDVDAYKRAQGMDFREVARMADANMRRIGRRGIEELSTRKQEFKDELAQKMGPFGMQMNWLKQIQGLQETTGQTLGATIRTQLASTKMGRGMSEDQLESAARTLEQEVTDPKFFGAQRQQLEIQKREARGRARALRSSRRTPGALTRMGEGLRDFTGGISDSVTGWSRRNIFDPLARSSEERASFKRGERVLRYGQGELIHGEAEEDLVRRTAASDRFQGIYEQQGRDPFGLEDDGTGGTAAGLADRLIGPTSGVSRLGNRFKTAVGFGSYSTPNKISYAASLSRSSSWGHMFASFGDTEEDLKRVRDVQGAARGIYAAEDMTRAKSTESTRKIQAQGEALDVKGFDASMVMASAGTELLWQVERLHHGTKWHGLNSATALSQSDVRKAMIKGAARQGIDEADAGAMFDAAPEEWTARMVGRVQATGSRRSLEVLDKSLSTDELAGGFSGAKSRKALDAEAKKLFKKAGISDISDKTMDKLSHVIVGKNKYAVAFAMLEAGSETDAGKEDYDRQMKMMKAALLEEAGGDEDKARELMTKYMAEGHQIAVDKLAPDKDLAGYVAKRFAREGQKTGQGAIEMVESMEEAIGFKKTGAMFKHGQEVLSDLAGGSQTSVQQAKNLFQAFKRVNLSQLEKGSEEYKLAAKIQADVKGEDTEALEKEVTEWGLGVAPDAMRETMGGGRGGREEREIEKKIREVEQMEKKIIGKKGAASEEELAVMEAKSSTLLAKAAEKLDSAADKFGIIIADYRHQGTR